MALFPNIIAGYRVLTFVFLLLSALLCYVVCLETRMLSPWESLSISMIQLAFPAFRVMCCLYMLPFIMSISLFLLGAYLALKNLSGGNGVSLVLRMLSLICFFLSFTTNSLLVFYLGFILLMIFTVRRRRGIPILAAAKRYLPRHIDFLMLPFLYWFINELYFPRTGFYSKYNRLLFLPKSQLPEFVRFIDNAVLLQLNEALLNLLELPVIWLLLIAAILLARSRIGENRGGFFGSSSSSRSLIGFGAVLLVLAVFPYLIVTKVSLMYGCDTRFSLLVSMGVGVILVGVMKAIFQKADGRITFAGVIVLASLILAFTVTMIENDVSLQMRWIKECSIQHNLRNMPKCPAGTYWIEDQFRLPQDASSSEQYNTEEWVAIFNAAWGEESRMGLYVDQDIFSLWQVWGPMLVKLFYLSAYDPHGPQARLTIRPGLSVVNSARGSNCSTYGMVLWYWWYRYVNTRRYETFIERVTEVTLTMLPETPVPPKSFIPAGIGHSLQKGDSISASTAVWTD
ncbi:MAG: hypothetical protein PHD74_05680 [Candidatus Krumholzibacteria bacterium]|nr:hypothetical protein [Candidatus Krumholzibacteria bacterium]